MGSDCNRVSKGNGRKSGEFTFKTTPDEPVALKQEDAPPLRDFRIVGYERKIYKSPGDEPRPAGVCYHCGSSIMNCIVIENPKTGEIVDVGETCAERVGLDMNALRAMLRERNYADQREASRKEREAEAQTRAEREAADIAKFGEHGTESRWDSGCRCDLCSAKSPHGSVERLTYGKCYCAECLQAAIDSGKYYYEDRRKLVDIDTNQILPAKCVGTKYGLSWVVNSEDGSASWYPYSPARRGTLAKRGAVEVNVKCLIRPYYYDGQQHFKEVAMLEAPDTDAWGEPIQVDLNRDTDEPI
jgi:hypothetical protein